MKRTMFPMRFSTSWFLVVMMVLSLCAASGVVLAVVTYDTTYVDDNGPLGGNHFQDIAAALAQTEAGGTIYIATGTYVLSSPLAPNNDVTFVGEGADRVFIDASGVSRAFDVQDVSFGLYGCTVFGASTCVMIQWDDDARDYAASLQGNAIHSAREPDTGVSVILSGTYGEVDIIGNAIHDNFGFGISFYLSTNAELFSTILDNDIYDNTGTGISLVADGSKVGMSIEKNMVYGNGTLTNNTGVYASFLHTDVEYLSIEGNAIHDNHGDGIHIVFTGMTEAPPTDGAVMVIAETLDISGNEIVRNVGNGIAIELDFLPPAPEGQGTFPFDVAGILSEAVIADNRIDDNALTGILIDTDACFSPVSQDGTPQQVVSLLFDVYIEKNLVRGNGSGGIYCNAPFNFGIFNNLIAGNGGQAHGVSIRADSVSFWHNTVTGNSTGVFFGANFSFFNNIIASNNS
ncbi:MAG: right-handed parallel beta-helix repeat-containing protein, partial [Candidatus Methanofastidiosa archaeon]|nr:right-handed parallel beta-helix repeat-containing protein [Candidatus Methanofastidiosa archaeon]